MFEAIARVGSAAAVAVMLAAAPGAVAAAERVTCYRSYGFQQDQQWVVPVHVWVHEPRGFAETAMAAIVRSLGGLAAPEQANLRLRTMSFLSDDQSREEVVLADATGARFPVVDAAGKPVLTDANGRAVGRLVLPAAGAA